MEPALNEEINQEYSQPVQDVRPLVRFFARMIDISVGMIIIFISCFSVGVLGAFASVIGLIYKSKLISLDERIGEMHNYTFWFLIVLPTLMVSEALSFKIFGTTPGKWILNTRVRKSLTGKKLSFRNALNRTFQVWYRGLAFGFLIVTVATLSNAYKTLSNEHTTTWDKIGGYSVTHGHISVGRVIIAIILFVSGLGFMVI